jgi:hypothetical protein
MHWYRPVVGPRREQRGVALVELAICISLLSTLAFGTFEFGYAWKQRISLQAITRSAGRIGSNLGSSSSADRQIVGAVVTASASLPGGVSSIGSIVVFKATCTTAPCTAPYTSPTQVDARCDPAPDLTYGSGVDLKCNVYFPRNWPDPSAPPWGVGATALDRYWNPTTRNQSTNGTGPDYVGVRINYTHRMIVGIFGSKLPMTDDVVFRLEPA